jgi:hypothetical protein
MQIYKFQRAHYRIQYPEAARPVFVPGHLPHGFPVIDCSEQGLRYHPGGPHLPPIGTEAHGTIRFRSGEEVEVSGTVVRIQDQEVALHLSSGSIPWRVLLREQLLLRKEFPLWN